MNTNQDWKALAKIFHNAKNEVEQLNGVHFPVTNIIKTLKTQGFAVTVKLNRNNDIKGIFIKVNNKDIALHKLIGDDFKWSKVKSFTSYNPDLDAVKIQISNSNYQILN